MLWDILGGMISGLFEPGPPTTEKAARRRAAYALCVSAVNAVGVIVLVILGALADDPDDRSFCFVLAGCCFVLMGISWFSARQMLLDHRRDS